MLIDLLSSSNQVSFNSKIAQSVGLHAAVYLSELIAMNVRAEENKAITINEGIPYFNVDRSYIKERTTLEQEEQKKLDKVLAKFNIVILRPKTTKYISLDIDSILTLLNADVKDKVQEQMENLSKIRATNAKKQYDVTAAKSYIKSNDAYLRPELEKWVEGCIERYGKITRSTVEYNEKLLLDAANGDTKLAATIAELNFKCYDSMKYAIDDYKNSCAEQSNTMEVNHKVVTNEVF